MSAQLMAVPLKLNQIQVIGTHNSFKQGIPASELKVISWFDHKAATELDYAFEQNLTQQLQRGVRQLELDLYYDPQGGRFAEPLLSRLPFIGEPHPQAELMQQPGFKVMHVQDVDYRSSCYLFRQCLQQLKTWSESQPQHLPVLVVINLKQENLGVWGTTTALPFDQNALVALEQELTSIMQEYLVTPTMIRGDSPSLNQTVQQKGWPELERGKGKFIFLLDAEQELLTRYSSAVKDGQFFSSWPANHPQSAVIVINDPIAQQQQIKELVAKGFIVRTRADADTYEARVNTTERMQAAFTSGAQYISTDYIQADLRFSQYQVSFEQQQLQRCNPLLTKEHCLLQ